MGRFSFLTYPRLNTVFGEFLHNLQSALDHLAWELVLKNGCKSKELKTAFLILQTSRSRGSDRDQFVLALRT